MFSKNFLFFDSTATSATSNEFGLGGGDGAMNVQVAKLQSGSFTLKFQGCVDTENNKWVDIKAVNLSSFATVASITGEGSYVVPLVGFQKVRAVAGSAAQAPKLKVYGISVS